MPPKLQLFAILGANSLPAFQEACFATDSVYITMQSHGVSARRNRGCVLNKNVIEYKPRGYGGIGRHVGFRFQWATVQVRVLLPAPYYDVTLIAVRREKSPRFLGDFSLCPHQF